MQWKKKQSDRLPTMSLEQVDEDSGKVVAKVQDTGYVGVPVSEFGKGSGTPALPSSQIGRMASDDTNAYTGKAVAQYVAGHMPVIVVDSELSYTSENPVQNRVVSGAISNVAMSAEAGVEAKAIIDAVVPSAATASNQLADKAYVDFGVEQVAARYLSADAFGNPFSSYAQFSSGIFYYDNSVTTPTKNDYVLVNGDEEHDDAVTRYWYTGSTWAFQYVVNTSPLNAAQLAAINSTITSAKVSSYENHLNNDDIHVTSSEKTVWNGKQDKLSTTQQNAVDSTITSAKVTTYDNHVADDDIHVTKTQKDAWDGKQDKLSTTQQNAVDSTITSAKVTSYDNHVADGDIHVTTSEKTAWDGKQDKLSSEQQDAVDSKITPTKVTSYDTHIADDDIHVTASEKTTWNGKYAKPDSGIPLSDLASSVQTSLGKADTAVQSSALSSYVKKAGDTMTGRLTVQAAGGDQAKAADGAIVVKMTAAANKTGVSTNGSVFAGDLDNTNSQFVGVRRKTDSGAKVGARFQIYKRSASDNGTAAFMQVDYTSTATVKSIFEFGHNYGTKEDNWGTMTFGDVTKNVAFKEDLTVDTEMSESSTNPVQNKVVTAAIDNAVSGAIKGYADSSNLHIDDTHAYTGKAIANYVTSAIGGNVGGYLGVLTNSEVTSKTDWKPSDWFVAGEKGISVPYSTDAAHTITYESGDEIYLQSNGLLSVKPDTGKLNVDASNATAYTSDGIFNKAMERPDDTGYDVRSGDVVLVQDENGSVMRTTVSRLHKNINENQRGLSTELSSLTTTVSDGFKDVNARVTAVETSKLDANGASVAVKDFGNTAESIYCGYRGGSIGKVSPKGGTAKDHTKYLIGCYRDTTTNATYYKDVDASVVTVHGAEVADSATMADSAQTASKAAVAETAKNDSNGNPIATTYATLIPKDITDRGSSISGYIAPSVLCVVQNSASSVTISSIVATCVSPNYRDNNGCSYKILNASGASFTITGFAGSKTWSLPNNTFMNAVCWNDAYYREDT